ncbi:periplasmic chaperone for outer membrane proteins Skp [Halospina denitrificans]|uniref:Periplasmic chaperone for outer membrane proteins Skp n=1 Tax=Halospina denitrificans TaxID=332522 RepID=A0A4R7K180_9GAMM|nr:OmpH family outer membrane protein [Halospina denitrificans]TDT43189.1 periplasmic chaperone for outer membrane proteins Skp [Halospina denitrificans]
MHGIKQVTAVMMLLLAAMPVLAENRIGVVNLREAVFSSDAGSEFGDVIQGELKKEQESIRALEEEAKELQERLKTDGSMMNESERGDLESEFEQKAREYQQRRARFEQAVSQRQQQFLQQSRPAVDAAMEKLLDQHDLDLIIPGEAVIYVKPDLDLTDEMIELLDAQAESGS